MGDKKQAPRVMVKMKSVVSNARSAVFVFALAGVMLIGCAVYVAVAPAFQEDQPVVIQGAGRL